MSRPNVSVCVVTYNQAHFIRDCLTSVLAQHADLDIEILVGDDASTDTTGEAVEQLAAAYPGLIQYHRHETNLGPARNYQFLIERARGEFIAHLDGDDYWMPGKLARQVDFLRGHRACSAVYSNAVVVSEDRRLLGVFNNELPETFDLDFLLAKGNFLNHSSLVYRAEFKDAVLGIPGAFIDYRIHLRLARRGKLGYLNQALVCYRVAGANSMVNSVPDLVRQWYWQALLDAEVRTASAYALRGAMSHFFGGIATAAIVHGQLAQAARWMRRIVREAPLSPVPVLCLGAFIGVMRLFATLARRASGKIRGNDLLIYYRR